MPHELIPHENFMRRCFELALKGRGYVSPNPVVGAVIVHDQQIVAEGYHHKFGGPHAEVEALQALTNREILSDSTLYVSLEPCCHFGKTPPCVDLIIKSKIPRVVVACRDPHAVVNGGGIRKLEDAGIQVIDGVLEREALEINRGFFSFHQRQRPWVILKWAETADCFIARNDGSSKWISCEESRRLVHRWRSEEDAVLVGRKTAVVDDPKLTVRSALGRNPVRVVLDSRGILPKSLQLFSGEAKTIVLNLVRHEDCGEVGWRKIAPDQGLAHGILGALYQERILSLIVEGGAQLINAFLEENLWDEARVFSSPVTFGEGIKAPKIKRVAYQRKTIGHDALSIYFREDF